MSPILLLLSILGSFNSLNVEILGVSLEGSQFSAVLKLILWTIFLFGGMVGYLLLTGSRMAFVVGLIYCGYSAVVSASFHFSGVGTSSEGLVLTIAQYGLLGAFGLYLALRKKTWESVLVRN